MFKYFHVAVILLIVFFSLPGISQNIQVIDIQKLVKSNGIEVYNREISVVDEPGYTGISLSKNEGEGLAWIKGIEFSNGIIEFDVRGEDLRQHSFVGFAFHGKDDTTFDAIYLRPFQFKEESEVLRNRAIQYISLPDFPWRTLREKSPGKYEHSIEPTPDPNAWIRVRLVIKGTSVSTYINGNTEPSLVIEKVTALRKGAIGFYVADTSGGDFANLTITKAE